MHESESRSRNHSVIKATSVNHQAQLHKLESWEQWQQAMHAFCFFVFFFLTFDPNWHKQGGCRKKRGSGGNKFFLRDVSWSWLMEIAMVWCAIMTATWRFSHSNNLITCKVLPGGQQFDCKSLSSIVPTSGRKCFQSFWDFCLALISPSGCDQSGSPRLLIAAQKNKTVKKEIRLIRPVLCTVLNINKWGLKKKAKNFERMFHLVHLVGRSEVETKHCLAWQAKTIVNVAAK